MIKLYRALSEITELLKQQNLQKKELLTFDEACLYLGFQKSYLYKKTANGEIPCYTPTGRKLVFRRSELMDWALRNRKTTSEEIDLKANEYLMKSR